MGDWSDNLEYEQREYYGHLYEPDREEEPEEETEEMTVENKGTWIYDKSIYNWRCSECGQTPPPTGYVGKAEFMETHFKFCNYCGARMEGCEE